MKKILFVCTGNTCRSPMAQALFMKYLSTYSKHEAYEVISAGIFAHAGNPVSLETSLLLQKEEGIDLSSHQSQCIDTDMVQGADLILTMTREHKNFIINQYPLPDGKEIHTLSEYVGQNHEDIIDPIGGGLESYRECLQQMRGLIHMLVKKIMEFDK